MLPATGEPRTHGTDGDAGHVGRLLIAKLFDITKNNDQAMIRIEGLELLGQPGRKLRALQRGEGVGDPGWLEIQRITTISGELVGSDLVPGTPRLERVEVQVPQDPGKPGQHGLALAKPVKCAECADQRLLGQVRRLVPVAAQRQGDAKEPLMKRTGRLDKARDEVATRRLE